MVIYANQLPLCRGLVSSGIKPGAHTAGIPEVIT